MLRAALDDLATRVLLHVAMQAAAATLDEQKVDTLARALANGLDDGTKVDYEVLVIRALSDLDPVHVRVLRMLNGSKSQKKGLTAQEIQSYIDAASEVARGGRSAPTGVRPRRKCVKRTGTTPQQRP